MFKLNQYVKIKNSNIYGRIKSIEPDGFIKIEGISFCFNPSQIEECIWN